MSTPRLSEHFNIAEFLPAGYGLAQVPPQVEANITMLVAKLLEPLRQACGLAIQIHDGWRPPEHNAEVDGAQHSDHLIGAAADFHVCAGPTAPSWHANTIEAFDWLRIAKAGVYGQLILEDWRASLKNDGKLWIHAALPSERHPGTASDTNLLLVSYQPRAYQVWRPDAPP